MPAPPFDEEGTLDDDEEEEWLGVGEEGAPGFRAALFSSQAACYAAYRPHYPEHVGASCTVALNPCA